VSTISTVRQILRGGPMVALLAAATVFLAACNQLDDASFGFWDLLWGMVVFFFWFMLIWIFISIFADIFRRNDLSGGWKAIWIIVLVLLPFLGALVYIIARPKATAQDIQLMAQADAAQQAAAGVSTADELAKLNQLKQAGAINDQEYEQLKQKLMS
jgi:uncharacterized membrane protein